MAVADAATVLVALNWLWRLNLDEDTLAELGRQLGADVPVFVRGRSAWAEGIGEQLTPLPLPRERMWCSTRMSMCRRRAFQASEIDTKCSAGDNFILCFCETTENAFAPVVRARHPRVAAALDWLGGFGQARLSGSGGCVFLETKSFERAVSIAGQCPVAFTPTRPRGSMFHRCSRLWRGINRARSETTHGVRWRHGEPQRVRTKAQSNTYYWGVAKLVKARDFDSRIRRFESCRPRPFLMA